MKMNKIKMAMVGVSALVLSMLAFSAQAIPVVLNGSFSNATSTDFFAGPPPYPFVFPSPYALGSPNFEIPTGIQSNLPNWTVTAGPSNLPNLPPLDCLVFAAWPPTIHACGGGFKFWLDPGLSPDGGNYIAFDGDSTVAHSIFQDITDLVPNQFYNVSFYQAAGQLTDRTGDTTEQWEVSLGTEPSQLSMLMKNDSKSFVPWSFSGLQTLTFKAMSTTETLRFLAKGSPNGLPPFVLLDGVSITAVPEPETYALLGIGLLGILAVRRQQQKRA